MGLLSFLQRHPDNAQEPPAVAPADAVAAARIRARRRLIGATVLLGVGIVGFPLLFETQPRPIPVNIPIEIPRKDGLTPLQLPAAAPALAPASGAVVAAAPALPAEAPAEPVVPARPAEITERLGEQGRELPAPASSKPPAVAPAASKPPVQPPAASKPPADKPRPVEKPPEKHAEKPAERPQDKPASRPADDGARAKALLEGQPSASAPGARVVVQVGAYADAGKLAEARHKLEKLGLKTYTQVVEADGAKRTRVRVGPFASKAEADKAAARIKAAGLPAAILTL